jgi:hypothetical protein
MMEARSPFFCIVIYETGLVNNSQHFLIARWNVAGELIRWPALLGGSGFWAEKGPEL